MVKGNGAEDWANKQVFTTGEAAEICKVSQQTIIRCFDSGRLQGFRVPGSKFRRIPRAELLRFMKANDIPTDVLGRVAPETAEWCVENFSYNNVFDNMAARTDLGFEYTIPFAEGARRVVEWLDALGGFEDSEQYPFYDQIIESWKRLGADMARELQGLVE